MFNIILQSFIVFHYVVSHMSFLCLSEPPAQTSVRQSELEVKPTNLTTCTISASTDFFFSFLFFLHFLIWYTFHKWTSLWLLNTSCTITFFCLFSINITEAIYNSDLNKTSTIHLNPYFQWFFFSSDKCTIFFFHSLKYYTVKKKQCIFSCSPVTVGGKQQPLSLVLKRISVSICQNTFWSLAEWIYFNAFNSFALHSAYLLQ